MLHIRRPILHDLAACANLDGSYVTHRVWQMQLRPESNSIEVDFHLIHLPRPLTVSDTIADDNLLKYWQRGDGMFVAKLDNITVGYMHVIPDQATRVCTINRHVVAPDYRRRRIGENLLHRAIQWGREHRMLGMRLGLSTKNYPGFEFYQAHGFIFTGFDERFYSDQEITLYFARSIR